MSKNKEKRNPEITIPIIGDVNRLRRKEDIPLREKLLDTISKTSQSSPYLMSVSEQQVGKELAHGHIRAIVDGNEQITAHLRCLPISNNISFLMTLQGKTGEQVLEILNHLAEDKTITLETVNKHLRDLGITESDLLSAGFERTSAAELGLLHLARANLYYLNSDPVRYIKGYFESDTGPREYKVFVRRRRILKTFSNKV